MHKLFRIIGKSFQYAIAAVIIAAAIMTIPPKVDQWRGMQRKRDMLRIEIERKKRDINEMKENQHRFKTDRDFVERIARENKRVQPGELVFIFDPTFTK